MQSKFELASILKKEIRTLLNKLSANRLIDVYEFRDYSEYLFSRRLSLIELERVKYRLNAMLVCPLSTEQANEGQGQGGLDNLTLHGVDSQTAHNAPPTINVGSSIQEQSMVIYSDFCGVKRTPWFASSRLNVIRHRIERQGSYISSIKSREVVCDIFLLPNNHLDHQFVEVLK